ncbi:MAG: hypothetical protein H7A51_13530 [Akkermansiaceae bacterium]|nr:hypothetical protein [Akkermansiaceae bacterium]
MNASQQSAAKGLVKLWVVFILLHLVLLTVDWVIRGQSGAAQSQLDNEGWINLLICWMSMVGFFVYSIILQPFEWPWWLKFIAGVLHTSVAIFLLFILRIFYAISNGGTF